MGDTRYATRAARRAPRARLASMAARALACARRCRRLSETGADAPSGARRLLPAGRRCGSPRRVPAARGFRAKTRSTDYNANKEDST
ncbi:hypothetical protein UKMH10_6166 [Burkholderia pseudomallei]|nr:hypothetical protein UKMH10_6166 [Burkholderia pseudomallei]